MPSLLSRGASTRADGEEWYIPYRPEGSGHGINYNQGIGYTAHAPAPRPSTSSTLLRAFSPRTSAPRGGAGPGHARAGELNRSYEFPPVSSTGFPSAHASSSRPHKPLPPLTSLHPSPSYMSLDPSRSSLPRLASSNSVPSGLAEPKILYSPINRQLRAPHTSSLYPPASYAQPRLHPAEPPRQRTTSAPSFVAPRSARRPDEHRHHRRGSSDHRGWAAATMCDMLVFPRPSLRPHSFTPPDEPADPLSDTQAARVVVEQGDKRRQEREAWHDYTHQPRSMSFGSSHGGVGVGRQNSAGHRALTEKQRRQDSLARSQSGASGRRKRSVESKTERTVGPRRESGQSEGVRTSFGRRLKPSTAATAKYEDVGISSATPPTVGAETGPRRASHDPVTPPRHKDGQVREKRRALSESSPAQPPLWPDMSDYPVIPPRRSSRIVQVREAPMLDKNGVILIPSEASGGAVADGSSTTSQRRRSSDRFKPLPSTPSAPAVLNIPAQKTQKYTSFASAGSLVSSRSERQSSQISLAPRQSVSSVASTELASTRSYLAKQHQRAQTRKAFQVPTPVLPPARTKSNAAATARSNAPISATRIAQRESAISSYSQGSAPGSATVNRRASARSQLAAAEAARRSRAASLGEVEARQRSQRGSDLFHARASTSGITGPEDARERTVSSSSRSAPGRSITRPPTPLSPSLPHPLELVPPVPSRSAIWDLPERPLAAVRSSPVKSRSHPPSSPVLAAPVALSPANALGAGPSSDFHWLEATPRHRPKPVHSDSAASKSTVWSDAKSTIYTDASEGWDRSEQPTPTPTPGGLQLPAAAEESAKASPAVSADARESMDEPNFSGLFFRAPHTPLERSSSFQAVPLPTRKATDSSSIPHSRTEPLLGLGFYQTRPWPLPSDKRREAETGPYDDRRPSVAPSSSAGSVAELITPQFQHQGLFRQQSALSMDAADEGARAQAHVQAYAHSRLGPAFGMTKLEHPPAAEHANETETRISALISSPDPSTAGNTPALGGTPPMHEDTPVRFSRVRSGTGEVSREASAQAGMMGTRRKSEVPLFELNQTDSTPPMPPRSSPLPVAEGIADKAALPRSGLLETPAAHGRNLSAATEVATPVSPYSQTSFRRSMIDAFPTPPGGHDEHEHSDLSNAYETDLSSVQKDLSYLRMESGDISTEKM